MTTPDPMRPGFVPPAHQTATFDQTYAELSEWIDKLAESYRDVRAVNASTREVDIAGLSAWMQGTDATREGFAELLTVAVVRLAEHERQVRAKVAAAIEAQAEGLDYGDDRPPGMAYAAQLARGDQ